jgi:hypothetical protein
MVFTQIRTMLCAFLILFVPNFVRAQDGMASLVEKAFQSEVSSRRIPSHVSFWSHERSTRTSEHDWLEKVVEIEDGVIRRLISVDGQLLSPAMAAAEDQRIANFVANPDEFRRLNQDRHSDEQIAFDLMKVIPQAFVFRYEGHTGDCTKIHFTPNPAFTPSTYQQRVLQALEGTIEIKEPDDRICSVEARISHPVTIGFGLIGRVDENGTLRFSRVRTPWGLWKTSTVNIHINGRILLLKSLAKDQDESRTKITDLPQHLSLAEAAALLTRP